jgi:hypothetical protein
MVTKKNKEKKQTKRKKAATKKAAPKKRPTPKKNLTKSKASSKKAAPRKKPAPKKLRVRGKSQSVDTVVLEPKGLGARSGGQSGDLQGLSNKEGAASESVDELLEEGNAFEAAVVKGVEDASDADEGEVVTHEVPEDDVPEEYRDKDR